MCSDNMAKNSSKCPPVAKISVLQGYWGYQIELWWQNFDGKFGNSSLCTCTVQIWPKQPRMTDGTSDGLKLQTFAIVTFSSQVVLTVAG